jgi:hypothetical protein
MNTKNELWEIDGYPEIVSHIVGISDVVLLNLAEAKSYSFTVSLDNQRCINVSQAIDVTNAMEAHDAIYRLRDKLLSVVKESNPIYISIPKVSSGE